MALFGLFRKKRAPAKDPIAAFDGLLEQLDRQAAQVRKSAAALLTARSELVRTLQGQKRQLDGISSRIGAAKDDEAARILAKDKAAVAASAADTERALHKISADADVLLDLAKELSDQREALRKERTSAHVQLEAEGAFTQALSAKSARIEQLLAVDAARDEIERAHALAQIVREDAGLKAR